MKAYKYTGLNQEHRAERGLLSTHDQIDVSVYAFIHIWLYVSIGALRAKGLPALSIFYVLSQRLPVSNPAEER
jgi:hypothetical protein